MFWFAVVAVLLATLYKILRFLYFKWRGKKFVQIGIQKRKERDLLIEKFSLPQINIPNERKEEIIKSDVCELREMLLQGKVTSEQLTIIFIGRALEKGKDLNLLSEINFEEAIKTAKEYDLKFLQKNKDIEKPLFGIPMTIKDVFDIKGLDSTIGMGCNCNKPKKEDGYLVKLLKEKGAIIFAKTNVPQASMSMETYNTIWGRGLNPWNKDRSVGGSSGGEAAMVRISATPIGIGSDVGGSIRTPSSFCGVLGFMPTAKRVTTNGH